MKNSIILDNSNIISNDSSQIKEELLLEANQIIFKTENSMSLESADSFKDLKSIFNGTILNELKKKSNLIKSIDNRMNRNKYKIILKKIENHLKNPKNHMYQVKELYIKNFIKKNEFYVHEIKYNFLKLAQILEILYSDIKNFIIIFTETIMIYYKIPSLQKIIEKELYEIIYSENFNNFITCVIFDERIYSLLFEIQKKIDISKEKKIEKYLDFHVNNYNEKFNISGKILIMNEENFEYSIKCLKTLQFFASPIHKLKVIIK